MKNRLKKNTRIKLISLLSAIVLWMYVMAIVDPEDTKLFESVPVSLTNIEELSDEDLIVYPENDLVADIYIRGKLSYLQKLSKEDIHIYGSINNPIEGRNYLYLKVNTTKQVSYEFKSDFIVVRLEKVVNEEKDIKSDVTGDYSEDVDTVVLQQSTVNISGARVLVEEVNHVKAVIDVNSNVNNKFTQKVKLIPVNKSGKEVKGVTLDSKNISAEITLLEEKEVPINIQSDGNLNEEKAYEINPETIIIKGKKEILDNINYINTEKVDLSSIVASKKVNLIIPEGVTSNDKTVIIKVKESESIVQRLIYNSEEIELRNNYDEINTSELNIPESINVEINTNDPSIKVSKSDIKLYIDLSEGYNESKKYDIKYDSDVELKNIKIIPNVIGL
ncbi:CdaR family protein [Terrisporobacter sp.]|uniref:CdaR family protein n=1 Tax=Terrisporobacter sp. TaxID=1965305 RepID=UPI002617CCA5|nr:CdaR family protein [Terrisporobacter sp.]